MSHADRLLRKQFAPPPGPLGPRSSLVQRRAVLVTACAAQRDALGEQARQLRALLSPAGLAAAAGRARLPVLLGAGGLGLLALLGLVKWRPRRLAPLLTAAMSIWKGVRGTLPVLATLRGLLQRDRG